MPPSAELQWWYQYLLRDRTRPAGLRKIPARVFKTDLAARLAEVEFRRRHLRAQRGVLRQSGSCRHRDPQLSLAARPRPRARRNTTIWKSGWPNSPSSPCPTITLEGDANGAPHPDPNAYAKKFSGKYAHRLVTGGIGHNLPQEAPQAFAEAVIEVARLLKPEVPGRRSRAACRRGRIAVFPGRKRERNPITFRRGLNLALVIPDINKAGNHLINGGKNLTCEGTKTLCCRAVTVARHRARGIAAKQPN